MDRISIAEAAEKWGIRPRCVQALCGQGRIPGIAKLGRGWANPRNAEKPADVRKPRSGQ